MGTGEDSKLILACLRSPDTAVLKLCLSGIYAFAVALGCLSLRSKLIPKVLNAKTPNIVVGSGTDAISCCPP
jgi:hypothetical protein